MAKSDLLADAIADAKKVKKTALANAKIALEEAFQPTLQRMISTKLAEEDDMGDEDEFDIDIDIQPETGETVPVAPEQGAVGMGSFDDTAETPLPVDGDEEPDQELESLIRELEGSPEEDEYDMFAEGEEEDWQEPIPDEPIQEADGYDEDLPEDENDLTEAEVRALSSLFEEEGLGDIDGPENEDCGSFTEPVPSSKLNFESRRLRNENAKLRKSLNKAYAVVTSLKKTINEVNLLNAKLMFTTRALKAKDSMTESQQMRVMKSIDRGKSVREVQLIYTSIMEAMNRKPTPRLNEGFASKTTRAINPSPSNKSPLNESKTADVIKWQRLAGILPPADY